MHVHDEPALTCVSPISASVSIGTKVTAIKVLGAAKKMRGVQRACDERGVTQSGYRESGKSISAATLLA